MAERLGEDTFDERINACKRLILVDFYSDSCIACKAISPVIGDIEDDYGEKLVVFRVNTGFSQGLAEKYEVLSNPTLMLIKNGQEVDRKVGLKKYPELSAWIDANLDY